MNTNEKILAKRLFELRIHKSDGNEFEKLFTKIMGHHDDDFRSIKPWGNIGDRKNDGYIEDKGIYYQVFAPEDIRKSYVSTVDKIVTDFTGLLSQWPGVKEFYFVVNDKYRGVNADCEQAITALKTTPGVEKCKILTASNLEKILFNLDNEHIYDVISFLPALDDITDLDYSIMNEVVGHIMKLPITPQKGEIKFPDWNEKIEFNKLSPETKHYLDNASQKLGDLDVYLEGNSFLAEKLQEQISGIYMKKLSEVREVNDVEYTGDGVFWEILNECCPESAAIYQSAVITVMAKYFESCDIFEDPISE